jgi:CBS domain-containing protein
MFQIIGAEGINRALVPGEFRFRGQVEPVQGVQAASPTPEISASDSHMPQKPLNKQGALVSRYQAPAIEDEPNEILFVREIMTKGVVTLPPTSSISEVAQLFSEHRYRHVPIVSPDGQVIGLISDRDVLKHQAKSSNRDRDKEPVSTIMVSEVLVATPDTFIRDAARTMFEEKIGSLPIIQGDNTIAGIVTRSDIMRALIVHGPVRIWA